VLIVFTVGRSYSLSLLDKRNPLVKFGIEADKFQEISKQYQAGEISEQEFSRAKADYFSLVEMYNGYGGS